MNTIPLNSTEIGPRQRNQNQDQTSDQKPVMAFTRFLKQAIMREGGGDIGADLGLQMNVSSFDQLGVLVLRAVSESTQTLNYEKKINANQIELSPNISKNVESEKQLEPNLNVNGVPAFIDNLNISSSTRSIRPNARFPSIRKTPINPVLVSVAETTTQLPQLVGLQGVAGIETSILETKISKIQDITQVVDLQNSDIEVSVLRGELGLIIIVKAPSLDARMSKALEQRLTRLVEQSGEKVDRIQFVSPEQLTEAPDTPFIERTSHGTD